MQQNTVGCVVGGGKFLAPPITKTGRLTGIEIEIEEVPELSAGDWGLLQPGGHLQFDEHWDVKSDGSLRNDGAEFVSKPINISVAMQALDKFYDSKVRHSWQPTVRCGYHVHVDVRDFTKESLLALFSAYSLVEPALFEFTGPDREECIYCIPWYRAPIDANFIARKLLSSLNVAGVVHALGFGGEKYQLSKYSAFYWAPVQWYGTVEFRQAPTWDNVELAKTWTRACWNIVQYCSDMTEHRIWEQWRRDPKGLLEELVGGTVPVSNQSLQNVGFWEIEERLERFRKTPVEEKWAPKMNELSLLKRRKRYKKSVKTRPAPYFYSHSLYNLDSLNSIWSLDNSEEEEQH
jgi:hypothetical protein